MHRLLCYGMTEPNFRGVQHEAFALRAIELVTNNGTA